jgi:hypothetical protein
MAQVIRETCRGHAMWIEVVGVIVLSGGQR